MNDHPIESLMSSVLENLKKMVDANTVIGEPIIVHNGVTIIPVTKLSFGFGCGGGDYALKVNANPNKMPFGGGTGGGISLLPLGFISISPDGSDVSYIPVEGSGKDIFSDGLSAAVDAISGICKNFQSKKKSKGENPETVVEEVEDYLE